MKVVMEAGQRGVIRTEAGEVEAAHERAQEARLDMTLMLFPENHWGETECSGHSVENGAEEGKNRQQSATGRWRGCRLGSGRRTWIEHTDTRKQELPGFGD